jgi:diguanylate cyclase (GGDEF)-like protein
VVQERDWDAVELMTSTEHDEEVVAAAPAAALDSVDVATTPPPRQPDDELDAPTEILIEETTANERTIALWRLVLCLVATVHVSIEILVVEPRRVEFHEWIALICVLVGVIYSAGMYYLLGRLRYKTVVSATSVAIDVTLVTAALIALIVADQPLFAVNNPLAVPLYLLMISLAGLRYNPHLTVFATLLAAAEYGLVIGCAVWLGDINNPDNPLVKAQIAEYGQFDLVMQLTIVVLLGVGGVVSTFSVRRARELREAAVRDSLTRVFNRGFFDARLQHEFTRAERYGHSLSLAMFDVDHFKNYNDRCGHLAGDEVLRQVAQTLKRALRTTDSVARYGGEEFVVLLPETGKDQAMALVERLRTFIEGQDFDYSEGQPLGRLTVSAGVACYPDNAETSEELVKYADDHLYAAKAAGRNCVRG